MYTPVGAERAGNDAGTIPEWQDGLPDWSAANIVDGGLADPFADDQELFRISAANLEQYRDNLSDGQVALLKRYPDTYYLPVYPSRRVATYPREILDRIKASAANISMVPSGNGLQNLNASTVPFPFPESALEVIWNHITRYRGAASSAPTPRFRCSPTAHSTRWYSRTNWYSPAL